MQKLPNLKDSNRLPGVFITGESITNMNNSTNIRKNSKSVLGMPIGTRRRCLMEKTEHEKSRDTVPLKNVEENCTKLPDIFMEYKHNRKLNRLVFLYSRYTKGQHFNYCPKLYRYHCVNLRNYQLSSFLQCIYTSSGWGGGYNGSPDCHWSHVLVVLS